jgi:adenosylhomocysteine nucleosidase
MESASIGHVCYVNKLPFIIIRGISDNSGADAEKEYQSNLSLAINNACDVAINHFKHF